MLSCPRSESASRKGSAAARPERGMVRGWYISESDGKEIAGRAKGRQTNAYRPFGAATWLRGIAIRISTLRQTSRRVNGAAVLAVGSEPTRAFARRIAIPSRLPVSPRQHLIRKATTGRPTQRRSNPIRAAAEDSRAPGGGRDHLFACLVHSVAMGAGACEFSTRGEFRKALTGPAGLEATDTTDDADSRGSLQNRESICVHPRASAKSVALTGPAGLEPATAGFGDRCSAT